jgi:homoserine kinase
MEIAVPGSVANLGGGFDTLAVAVQLYLRVRVVDVRDDGGGTLTVVRSTPAVSGTNAVERGFASAARSRGDRLPSVFAEVESDIPVAAGLGSSAAAAAAGVLLYERFAQPLADSERLAAVAALEGHADNAAAALFGGLTSVVDADGDLEPPNPWLPLRPRALQWHWPEDLRLVVATPSTRLATATARAALPTTVPRADAVFNLQRVLALVHALQEGDYDHLREAVRDRWHQPARTPLVAHLAPILAIEDPDVLGAFLSGAGPSVAVLARHDFTRVERLVASTCEAAGSPVVVRTLAVHHASHVPSSDFASAHGRSL